MFSLRHQPIAAAAATTLLVAAAFALGTFEAPERSTLAGRLLVRGPLPAPASIRIVAIDEHALERFGQMPWDRRRFAALLDRLRADGARAVGIDVAFNEPARRAEEDAVLETAIARFGRVVLPAYSLFKGEHGETTLFKPLPGYRRAAIALGLAQYNTSNEALELHPYAREGSALLPVFSLAVARAAGLAVPSFDDRYLNPFGPARHFSMLSFPDALSAPKGSFKNQVVLVGATAQGLPDTGFNWPFAQRGRLSGIELHATALANLLSNGGLRRLAIPWTLVGLTVLGLGPGAWLASDRSDSLGLRGLGLAAVLLGLMAIAESALWLGWWLELMPGLVLMSACFVVGLMAQEARLLGDRNQLLERYAEDLAREARREREQIDGELHDEAQQLLIALGRDLRRVRKVFERDPQEASLKLEQAESLSKRILDEVMRVRKALVPHTLHRSGLRAAVEEMAGDYAERAGLSIQVEVGDWPTRLDPVLESELYWLIKESLNNAIKHAEASTIRLRLERKGVQIVVGIEDDGRGFKVPDLERTPMGPEHSGLHRMWVRAQALRGVFALDSTPGNGSRLELRVPVEGGAR